MMGGVLCSRFISFLFSSTRFVVGDVRLFEDAERAVRTTVDTFGSLSILVNSAAGNFLANANELRWLNSQRNDGSRE